ncbi:MAG: T9SS type A sorting domain-containing protein [Chitinophagales bacterium]
MRWFFLAACCIIGLQTKAQYAIIEDIIVVIDGDTLLNPSMGGLHTPQFSNLDVDFDGDEDVFVFDRSCFKVMVFENILIDGERKFRYAQEYESQFPFLTDWALLKDYNCDGLKDIFTYYSGSTAVYKAVNTGGVLSFELAVEKIVYIDAFPISIYTSRSDIPDFADVNNDGDIDVVAFGVSGTTLRYFENTSQENFWGCDSLQFELIEYCWGDINEGASCSGADLGIVCKGNADNTVTEESKELHVGSTVLLFDKDGDSDEDLVLGDVSCSNLVYYKNGGDVEYATFTSKDTLFPTGTVGAKFHEYLSSFLADVNADGKKDLIVSTNDNNLGLNTDHTWLYENTGTDTFDFEFIKNDFLLDETIDLGQNSKPVFTDYNADGLIDIIAGVGNTYDETEARKYGVFLFENTGTVAEPVFTFITNDYAELAVYNIPELHPSFIDIDADGDEDMFVGLNDGTLAFLENIAGSGLPADYAAPEFNYQGIDAGINAAPVFFDVNTDGLIDLIVGEQNGNLNFYENTGSVTSAEFVLQNENFGGVDVREIGSLYGYSTPFFYRDEEDSLFLLVGSESGKIHKFDEIEESLFGEFHERDSLFPGYVPGRYTTISAFDINNDNKFEFVTGNNRGGVTFFGIDESVSVQNQSPAEFRVYPNPANRQFTVSLNFYDLPAKYKIYNVFGEETLSGKFALTQNQVVISSLSPGLYFLTVQTGDKKWESQKFIKQ